VAKPLTDNSRIDNATTALTPAGPAVAKILVFGPVSSHARFPASLPGHRDQATGYVISNIRLQT
jgi:hypothetical protein